MSNITMSILGLYNYDNTIFDEMQVPAGVDKTNVLIPNLLAELSELEVIYPRPDVMKTIIGVWSRRQLPVWTKLQATVNLEYNPIYNKDGYYSETETRDLANSKTGNNRNAKTGNNGRSETYGSTTTDNGNNTNSVSAFNSSAFENREKDTITNTRTVSGTDSYTDTISESITDTISESGTETGDITRERHEYGNIGVTTTQQMIKEEREVVQFNITGYIIEDFKQRFCIMVY